MRAVLKWLVVLCSLPLLARAQTNVPLKFERSGSLQFYLRGTAPAGRVGVVVHEYSTNLAHWRGLATNQANGGKVDLFLNYPPGQMRFYRARFYSKPTLSVVGETNIVAYEGSQATMRLKATGDGPLTYSFRRSNGGNPLATLTTNVWTFVATKAMGGQYTCSVSGPGGTAFNHEIRLTVIPPSGISPVGIAGKHIHMEITGGEFPFGEEGEYLFQPLANGSYTVLGLSFLFPNSFGSYSYTKTGTATATVAFSDSIVGGGNSQALTFLSATNGTYRLTKTGAVGYQKGMFHITN